MTVALMVLLGVGVKAVTDLLTRHGLASATATQLITWVLGIIALAVANVVNVPGSNLSIVMTLLAGALTGTIANLAHDAVTPTTPTEDQIEQYIIDTSHAASATTPNL